LARTRGPFPSSRSIEDDRLSCVYRSARNGPGRPFENDPTRSLITRDINDTRERYHRTNRDTTGLLGLAGLIYSSTLNFRIAAERWNASGQVRRYKFGRCCRDYWTRGLRNSSTGQDLALAELESENRRHSRHFCRYLNSINDARKSPKKKKRKSLDITYPALSARHRAGSRGIRNFLIHHRKSQFTINLPRRSRYRGIFLRQSEVNCPSTRIARILILRELATRGLASVRNIPRIIRDIPDNRTIAIVSFARTGLACIRGDDSREDSR